MDTILTKEEAQILSKKCTSFCGSGEYDWIREQILSVPVDVTSIPMTNERYEAKTEWLNGDRDEQWDVSDVRILLHEKEMELEARCIKSRKYVVEIGPYLGSGSVIMAKRS